MTSLSQSSIAKVQASVQAMHGGDREQATKYESYISWILRKRREGLGVSSIIKEYAK